MPLANRRRFTAEYKSRILDEPDACTESGELGELLEMLYQQFCDLPIVLIMDKASYQRCKLVLEKATSLNIQIVFLPPYSPNLNLMERLWKFVKRKVLYNQY